VPCSKVESTCLLEDTPELEHLYIGQLVPIRAAISVCNVPNPQVRLVSPNYSPREVAVLVVLLSAAPVLANDLGAVAAPRAYSFPRNLSR
jgi:hypothetical protein